jgi:hypothetical protein
MGGNRRRKLWEETIEETMGGNYRRKLEETIDLVC